MDKVAKALTLLRHSDELEKQGGLIGGIAESARALDRAGQAASKHLAGKGMKGTAAIARIAPHLGVAYAGKKAYESEPVQRLRAKYQRYKYNRAMKKAQRGY